MLPATPDLLLRESLFTNCVVALPVVLLLLGAGILALGTRSRSRLQWGLAIAVSVAAWLATLVGWRSVPAGLAISAWRPEDVFSDRILLMLDPIGWPIQLAAVSGLVAGLLADPLWRRPVKSYGWAGSLALTAAGLAAIQAGNLLSVALTWAILDVTRWLLPALLGSGEATRTKWIVNSGGVLLVLGAVVALPEGGLGRGLSSLGSNALAGALVLAGGGLRLGSAWRTPASEGGAGSESLGQLLRRVLPSAAVIAVMGRVVASAAGPLVPWVAGLGAIACLAGSLAWMNSPADADSIPSLALGLAGVAALSLVAAGTSVGPIWAASGVLLIVVGAVAILWRPFARGYRLAPRWASLALVGLPFTPGALVASSLATGVHGVVSWITGAIGLAGLAVMALGLWKRAEVPVEPWPESERIARAAHVGGILLLLVTLTLTYAALREGTAPTSGLRGGGIALGLLMVGIVIRSRWRWPRRVRGARAARWLDPGPISRTVGAPVRLLLEGVGRLADLLEGEAAVLWIYVIVLALSLAAGLGR